MRSATTTHRSSALLLSAVHPAVLSNFRLMGDAGCTGQRRREHGATGVPGPAASSRATASSWDGWATSRASASSWDGWATSRASASSWDGWATSRASASSASPAAPESTTHGPAVRGDDGPVVHSSTSDRKWTLSERQIPNFRGVRIALDTGYIRVEGGRRVSRTASELICHPKRFAAFASHVCDGLLSGVSGKRGWRCATETGRDKTTHVHRAGAAMAADAAARHTQSGAASSLSTEVHHHITGPQKSMKSWNGAPGSSDATSSLSAPPLATRTPRGVTCPQPKEAQPLSHAPTSE
jgi:hypothetical protein